MLVPTKQRETGLVSNNTSNTNRCRKLATAALMDPSRFYENEVKLANENFAIDEAARKLTYASGLLVTPRYRSKQETSRLARLPGIGYQKSMLEDPHVYEADLETLRAYEIKLTSFTEYFEGPIDI